MYYCNSVNTDTTVYNQDLSNVCTVSFNEDATLNISDWLIGGYSACTNTQLLTYVQSDVLAFFNNFYTIPSMIQANEPYMISTDDLKNVRADSSMIGFVIYDTTVQATKYWDGSSWGTTASRYLSSNGGKVNGNVGINTNDFGSGSMCLALSNAVSVPSTNPSGGVLYIEGCALKYRGSSGIVITLACA